MLYLFRAAALLASVVFATSVTAVENPYAEPETPGLPPSDMELDLPRVALVVTDPHKVYGPEQNDLVLQLRKQKIDQVILAGMSANLCVQAHMHELLEMGFEIAVVKDATAAAQIPEGDGYLAALVNFRFMANAVWTTDEAVKRLQQ